MHFQLASILAVALCASLAMGHCAYQNSPYYHADAIKVLPSNPHYHLSPLSGSFGASQILKTGPAGISVENAYGKSLSASGASIARYGYPLYAPHLSEVVHAAHVPSEKIVNVQVGVQRQPGYAVIGHDSYAPSQVLVNENVKLPSLALKEREAVVLGAEHQRSHQIVPGYAGNIVKNIGLGC